MTEATDREMRLAVEQWARAKGWWYAGVDSPPVNAGTRWLVQPAMSGSGDLVIHRPGPVGGTRETQLLGQRTAPLAALAWALVLEARPLRDGSRCKRCRGRGTWHEWKCYEDVSAGDGYTAVLLSVAGKDGWATEAFATRLRGRIDVHASRTIPCPDCDGTGLADLTDEYAQHVLDAQPRCLSCNVHGISTLTPSNELHPQGPGVGGLFIGCPNCKPDAWRPDRCPQATTRAGNPTSIEALHMLSDTLQGWVCTSCYRSALSAVQCPWCRGHTRPSPHAALGLHLAHLLAGEREGTRDAVTWLRERTPKPEAGSIPTQARGWPASMTGRVGPGSRFHRRERPGSPSP